jgi:hypothetical protein
MNHDENARFTAVSASFSIPITITVEFSSPTVIGPRAALLAGPPRERPLVPGEVERPVPTSALAVGQFSIESIRIADFNWRAAISSALASRLAYEERDPVEATAKNRWGFQSCQFVSAVDTECFVAATPAVVLIAFRGTAGVADWVADLNFRGIARPYGTVHRGFFHAFQDVQSQLLQILSAFPGVPVVLTGHSLGGALATVAAAEWRGQVSVARLYTFGQPAVGAGAFINFFDQHYANRFFRFVNDNDAVTRVPPGYEHVGRLFHFDSSGNLQGLAESASAGRAETPTMSHAEFDQLRAELLARRAANRRAGVSEPLVVEVETESLFGFPSFRDHSLDRYIEKIQRQRS